MSINTFGQQKIRIIDASFDSGYFPKEYIITENSISKNQYIRTEKISEVSISKPDTININTIYSELLSIKKDTIYFDLGFPKGGFEFIEFIVENDGHVISKFKLIPAGYDSLVSNENLTDSAFEIYYEIRNLF